MIVYRVADGKGWTKDTYTEVTTRAIGGGIKMSNLTSSTLRVAQNSAFEVAAQKSTGSGVLVTQDMSVYVDGKRSSEHV